MTRDRLKIAVASSGLGHVARGIEAWADDLATALAARGEDVVLYKGAGSATRPFEKVIPCWTREDPTTRRWQRLLPRHVCWRLGLGSCYGLEQTTFALRLLRILREERVDLLHVQDPQVALITQRAWRLGFIGTRTILAHGTEEPLAFQRKIAYLQHLAPWHLEEARRAGVWKPTWTAIPNFIDTHRFAPGRSDHVRAELGIPPDGLVVFCAAAIKRGHKRVDYLVREVAELRKNRPEVPVWLVVAGGWENDTDELIAEGQRLLGDRVRFLVRFPRARMPDLYRVADVFVLCSLFEMMPIALIEATASGLPCVINQHPILQWMTGEGGISIDMAVAGELAATLNNLLTLPNRRAALGRAAREHCLANFSRDAVVDNILAYYQQVAGPTRAASSSRFVNSRPRVLG
jgi:glycosyltransferase involved in cell wall biosynthesis